MHRYMNTLCISVTNKAMSFGQRFSCRLRLQVGPSSISSGFPKPWGSPKIIHVWLGDPRIAGNFHNCMCVCLFLRSWTKTSPNPKLS